MSEGALKGNFTFCLSTKDPSKNSSVSDKPDESIPAYIKPRPCGALRVPRAGKAVGFSGALVAQSVFTWEEYHLKIHAKLPAFFSSLACLSICRSFCPYCSQQSSNYAFLDASIRMID